MSNLRDESEYDARRKMSTTRQHEELMFQHKLSTNLPIFSSFVLCVGYKFFHVVSKNFSGLLWVALTLYQPSWYTCELPAIHERWNFHFGINIVLIQRFRVIVKLIVKGFWKCY